MSLLRVGILMGGKSLEHEVSFNSGRTICDHLDTEKYSAVPLFQDIDGTLYLLPWRFLYRGKISDFQSRLTNEAKKIAWDDLHVVVDVIYPAIHGKWAEDGTLQGMLEVLGLPYAGSKVYASASAFNKPFHDTLLANQKISVPRSIVIGAYNNDYSSAIDIFIQENPFPLIVKPTTQGSSFGVYTVTNGEELAQAIENARNIDTQTLQDVMVQEKICGMEFSCVAIQKNDTWVAFDATEIVHNDTAYIYDYIDKYMPGSGTKYTPARCSEKIKLKIKETVQHVAEIIGASDIIRVDGFVTSDNNIVIIESNTFPGMAPTSFTFSQAACENMSPTDLINETLSSALSEPFFMEQTIEKNSKKACKERKLRIAVLLGGESNEKEISLESGRNITYKLSSKYFVTPVFVSTNKNIYTISHELLSKFTTKEINEKVTQKMQIAWSSLPQLFDFVFIGLHGGIGENGSVQGTLEMLELPYNGSSVLTSSLCMNKVKTNNLLASHGFDVPKGFFISNKENIEAIMTTKIKENAITLPFIIKPHDDGCSCMVNLCTTIHDGCIAAKNIVNSGKTGCLIEEYVQGMELTVGVIGNDNPKALPPTYTPKRSTILSMTEKFLPGDGENITPAPLSTDDELFVKNTIEKAYITLQCKGYARIDCFFQNAEISPTKQRRLVILECNTLPALTPATCIFHQASELNIRPMELIDTIVQLGLELHAKNKQIVGEKNNYTTTTSI